METITFKKPILFKHDRVLIYEHLLHLSLHTKQKEKKVLVVPLANTYLGEPVLLIPETMTCAKLKILLTNKTL